MSESEVSVTSASRPFLERLLAVSRENGSVGFYIPEKIGGDPRIPVMRMRAIRHIVFDPDGVFPHVVPIIGYREKNEVDGVELLVMKDRPMFEDETRDDAIDRVAGEEGCVGIVVCYLPPQGEPDKAIPWLLELVASATYMEAWCGSPVRLCAIRDPEHVPPNGIWVAEMEVVDDE